MFKNIQSGCVKKAEELFNISEIEQIPPIDRRFWSSLIYSNVINQTSYNLVIRRISDSYNLTLTQPSSSNISFSNVDPQTSLELHGLVLPGTEYIFHVESEMGSKTICTYPPAPFTRKDTVRICTRKLNIHFNYKQFHKSKLVSTSFFFWSNHNFWEDSLN